MKGNPEHVAIVMDGNGRWATSKGMSRNEGHRRGQDAVDACVEAAVKAGLKHLTLYAFSTENWKRPSAEVRFLLNDTEDFILSRREAYAKMDVRMRWIGSRDRRVPRRILKVIDETTAMTSNRKGMTLTIAFNYGGRAEIVEAARAIAADAVAKGRSPSRLSEASVAKFLPEPGLPDVDLLIRTGGERRLSNFMLWRAAYAELYFCDTLWPDFDDASLGEALTDYRSRKRRFGSV